MMIRSAGRKMIGVRNDNWPPLRIGPLIRRLEKIGIRASFATQNPIVGSLLLSLGPVSFS